MDRALVVLSRDANPATIDAPGVPAGDYRDVLSGATLHSDGAHAVFTAPPLSAAIYFPEGSACLP
jgi:hypothetical protein